ncbi:MAG: hypothetical protein HOP29_15070 [Phycisphaerales bacterium]|nr:hypothetical protein [Phycisphaerales bacterium]
MAMRIVALVIIAALGLFVWQKKQQTESDELVEVPANQLNDDRILERPGEKHVDQTPEFFKKDVQGVEPPSQAEFNVDVELRMMGERPSLTFTVTEKHGWYADHLYVDFWNVNQAGDIQGESVRYMCHKYLDFGGTLVENTTPMVIEFPHLTGGFGTSADWRAVVGDSGKILAPK